MGEVGETGPSDAVIREVGKECSASDMACGNQLSVIGGHRPVLSPGWTQWEMGLIPAAHVQNRSIADTP